MIMNADTQILEQRCINTIRFLAADAVQKANSGHPGSSNPCFTLPDTIFPSIKSRISGSGALPGILPGGN